MSYIDDVVKEYNNNHQAPVFCKFGDENLIIPMSYKGDINTFIDDVTHFQDSYLDEYIKYNANKEHTTIEIPEGIKFGDFNIFPSIESFINKQGQEDIKKNFKKKVENFYQKSVQKALRAQKEFPNSGTLISLNPQKLMKMDALHNKYLFTRSKKSISYILKQSAEIIGGTLAAPIALAYTGLDKKYHFKKTPFHNFMKNKFVPYSSRGTMKALVPLALSGGLQMLQAQNKRPKLVSEPNIETLTIDNTPKTDLTKTFKITNKASFDKFYATAKPYFFQSILSSEILINSPYSDNDKDINTQGLGSYFAPVNGDYKSPKWNYFKNIYDKKMHKKISGIDACNLVEGWLKYREYGRVYKTLFEKLKGTELTIPQLVTVLDMTYHKEVYGFQFCDYLAKNYKNPEKCAKQIFTYNSMSPDLDSGIRKRRIHEYLLFTNFDNYFDKLLSLHVKRKWVKKNTYSCSSSFTQLSNNEALKFIYAVKSNNTQTIKRIYKKIMDYSTPDTESVYRIVKENNIENIVFANTHTASFHKEALTYHNQISSFNKAMELYENCEYKKAIKTFEKTVNMGYVNDKMYPPLADAFLKTKDYQKSIACCQKILSSNTPHYYAFANKVAGQAYMALGNKERALLNFKLAKKRAPELKEDIAHYERALTQAKPKNKFHVQNKSR